MMSRLSAAVLCVALGACTSAPPARNAALLYSVTGYEARAAKRAVVREIGAAGDLGPRDWQLIDESGHSVASGKLRALPETWGMRLSEADFSDIERPGRYRVRVGPAESAPFEIGERVLGRRIIRALSLENAALRNATSAQGGGFYDCNSLMGEARSHGSFVAGLADTLVRRGGDFDQADRGRLREQIRIGIRYLLALHRPGGGFADNHPARQMGRHDESNTPFALYGLAKSLAALDRQAPSDRELAARIVSIVRAERDRPSANLPAHLDASLTMLLYRYGGDAADAERATAQLRRHLASFKPDRGGGYAAEAAAPYFEALHDWLGAFPGHAERNVFVDAAREIARTGFLPVRASNGFRLFPVGEPRSYRDAVAAPGPVPKGAGPGGFWSNSKIARMALDAVLLAEITGEPAVADVATAALGWITGLNSGVEARFTSQGSPGDRSLVAASYIAHIAENHAMPWRRWWWPGDRSRVVSVVNGSTVTPEAGWAYSPDAFQSSETFIHIDGALLSALVAYEGYYFINN